MARERNFVVELTVGLYVGIILPTLAFPLNLAFSLREKELEDLNECSELGKRVSLDLGEM